jgi:RND family efflux transporter MFP subunit
MVAPRLSPFIFGLTASLVFPLGGCLGTTDRGKAPSPQALPVQLQTLESTPITESSEFVGTLIASEFVELAPQINGRILKIYANYGQMVKKNDPILLLNPIQQQEDVNAAVGNLDVQRANLSGSEADVRNIQAQRDGAQAFVLNQEANVANTIANYANAQETLKTKEADLKRAQSNLRLAQINYKRSDFLVRTGVQPQQDLDNKTTDLQDAQANVEAASKTVAAAQASVSAAQASIKASRASLSQSRENLRSLEQQVAVARAAVAAQRAAISQAQGQLGSTAQNLIFNRVLAPIDGEVGTITPKVGDYLRQGESFTTVTNNKVMEMNINVPLERSGQLRLGLPVKIVRPDGTEGTAGEISFISPTVNQSAQAILVKVIFPNKGDLRNNQYVKVRIVWNRQPGLLIPTSAITAIGAQKFVFVAQSQGENPDSRQLTARQTPVTLGEIYGQDYQVLSGVKAGDQVAVSRILELRDGVPIKKQSLTPTSAESKVQEPTTAN